MKETHFSEFVSAAQWGDLAEGSPLQPVVWPDLTARLAAMRDLRRSLAESSRARGANFSSLVEAVNEKAQSINLNASADRKGPAPNDTVDPNRMNPGDREMT